MQFPLLEPSSDLQPNEYRTVIVSEFCPQRLLIAHAAGWKFTSFEICKVIGKGYASTVYHTRCHRTRVEVAIKQYHKKRLTDLNHFQIRREASIHARLDHPNIISLYSMFEDRGSFYLVTELAAGGSLFHELRLRAMPGAPAMPEHEVVGRVVVPLLQALSHLDEKGIVHRDLKPENVLVTEAGVCKLGDFGLSICSLDERPVSRLGTLEFMAPEVLACLPKVRPEDHKAGPNSYGAAADVWALGCLIHECLTGRTPFRGDTREEVAARVAEGRAELSLQPGSLAYSFLALMLDRNPVARPGVADLLHHPYVLALAPPTDAMTAAHKAFVPPPRRTLGAALQGISSSSLPMHGGAPWAAAQQASAQVVQPSLRTGQLFRELDAAMAGPSGTGDEEPNFPAARPAAPSVRGKRRIAEIARQQRSREAEDVPGPSLYNVGVGGVAAGLWGAHHLGPGIPPPPLVQQRMRSRSLAEVEDDLGVGGLGLGPGPGIGGISVGMGSNQAPTSLAPAGNSLISSSLYLGAVPLYAGLGGGDPSAHDLRRPSAGVVPLNLVPLHPPPPRFDGAAYRPAGAPGIAQSSAVPPGALLPRPGGPHAPSQLLSTIQSAADVAHHSRSFRELIATMTGVKGLRSADIEQPRKISRRDVDDGMGDEGA